MKELVITSRQNAAVQLAVKLQKSRQERKKQRLFVADGLKLLEEAAAWGALDTVFLAEGVACCPLPEEVRVCRVSDRLMAAMSQMESPQGALFLCRMPALPPLSLQPGTLVLDSLQDPGNVGTILRTANALELPVVLTDGCADIFNAKTVRASMGAIFRQTPTVASADAVLAQARERGIPLVVTALSPRAKDLRTLRLRDAAVVIGNEGHGVGQTFLDAADGEAIIPMNPNCESLNASIAAAIVMWQMKQL